MERGCRVISDRVAVPSRSRSGLRRASARMRFRSAECWLAAHALDPGPGLAGHALVTRRCKMDPSTTLPTDPVARDVVYGSATPDGTLLFMTRNQAEEMARLRAALHSAQTWGDFQSLLSARSWRGGRAPPPPPGPAEPQT